MNTLLQGIRILDLSRLLPGPYCTTLLAQLGAEVIKVEEPKGDYTRTLSPEMFELVNRNKQSVTLDLRNPADVEKLKQLAKSCDVMLDTFRPGVLDKLGCGWEVMKAVNPKLVFAALTGYGQTGPYRDWAGHDMNYNGYAGALDQTGSANGAPTLSNFQIADLAGGALTCAVGILAAVIGARNSGHGTFVDVGMMDGTFALQAASFATMRTLGQSLPRGADMLSGAVPNYSTYECADGKYVAVGALEPKFFQKLCAELQRPDIFKMPSAPGKSAEAVRAELAKVFKTKTRDEWDQLLADKDCCTSGIYSPQENLSNPQVIARGLVENHLGKPAMANPIKFSDAKVTPSTPAPKLGADNATVFKA